MTKQEIIAGDRRVCFVAEIKFDSIDCMFSLSDVYDKVNFDDEL